MGIRGGILMKYFCLSLFLTVSFILLYAQQVEDELRTNSAVTLDAFSDPEGIIDEVRTRLKQGRFREGIELMQALLEKSFKDLTFSGNLYHRSENVYIPLEDFCVQLLKTMPLEGYDVYITLYNATAEKMLNKALESDNIADVELVSRLYPLTEAGQKALVLLADKALELGDGARALYYLNRTTQGAEKKTALTLLKIAAAMLAQGLKESAKEILSSLDDKSLSARELAIKNNLLRQTEGIKISARRQDIYNSFYESVSRYPMPENWKPILLEQSGRGYWDFKMTKGTAQQPAPRRGQWITPEGSQMTCPENQFPVVVGDTIYVMDTQKVYSVRLRGGSTLGWYPDESSPPVNYGTPFALETDGEILLCVLGSTKQALRTSERPQRGVIIIGGSAPMVNFNNDLYCFDISKETKPKPLWNAKDVNQGINSLVFFTPPKMVEGQILIGAVDVSGDKNQSFYLCSFSKYGQLLFKTKLCSIQQWSVVPGAIGYADGEAFVLTNSGVVASVNIYTGRLEWVALYPLSKSAEKVGQPRGFVVPVPPNRQTSLPMVWKGVYKGKLRRALFLAPTDSELIMSYDIDARRLLWLAPREMHSYYLGFFNDLVIATGGRSTMDSSKMAIRAYHIVKGTTNLHFETDKQVAGKGLIVGDELLLPCKTGLLRLAIKQQNKDFVAEEKGFYNWRTPTPQPPKSGEPATSQEGCGNLLLIENRIVTGYDICLYSCDLSQK